jgi:xanthine dehydrogenase FAD-binding subunit
MYDINNLYQPKSVEEALKMKNEHPEALVLAGGSDILIQIRDGKLAGTDLISIQTLNDLRGISVEEDGSILIRPLTSFSHVTQSPIIKEFIPALGDAVDQIGGPQIRNIGTIGGNICNGVTSADSASTLKAYDAILEISSVDGVRNLPYADFSKGPGRVDLQPNEILTGIRIPKDSYENTYGDYIKYSIRRAMDIATLGCSVNVRLSDDKKSIERVRIGYGVAGPTPMRVPTAEKLGCGKPITNQLIIDIAEATLIDVKPRTSWRATKEFRMQLIKELCKRALKSSIKQAGGTI